VHEDPDEVIDAAPATEVADDFVDQAGTEVTEVVEESVDPPAAEEEPDDALVGTESTEASGQDEAGDAAEVEDPPITHDQDDDREEADRREEASRGPAYETAPVEPSDVELEALVQTATAAEDRVRDRESEEEARDAWEDSVAAFDDVTAGEDDDAAVDEAVPVDVGWRKPWDEED
jgi:hypothetical protein